MPYCGASDPRSSTPMSGPSPIKSSLMLGSLRPASTALLPASSIGVGGGIKDSNIGGTAIAVTKTGAVSSRPCPSYGDSRLNDAKSLQLQSNLNSPSGLQPIDT